VALAVDDVGLVNVRHAWKVNGGDWTKADVPGATGRETPVSLDWYLKTLGLKAGDIVLTKLVGADAKGNIGESNVVRLVAITDPLSPERKI